MSDQDFKTVFEQPATETKIFDASKLEEIVVPDIHQAVEAVERKPSDDRVFVCFCGDPTCGFSAAANNLASQGFSDEYITASLQAHRVR